MKKNMVHHEWESAAAGTDHDCQTGRPAIKLGLDIHQARYVVVAQEGHATPKPARRFLPHEFLPWVETLLARGHAVFIVYAACGFGFGLCRQLQALGATCYFIAPHKLDEARKGVRTDALDAGVLCQRLSRYVEGNRKELAIIRIPTEAQDPSRLW